jgi:WD40 repeat protein
MGDRYDLYLWNTGTGALIDQLTGPQVELQDLSFHPTRSFVAVATADGLIDVWGPRMDWTAFAPDFQALPRNVEYVEKEDEFDVVVDGDGADEERKKKEAEAKVKEEGATVDVVTIDQIPVFDSDSEDENAVHVFQFKI